MHEMRASDRNLYSALLSKSATQVIAYSRAANVISPDFVLTTTPVIAGHWLCWLGMLETRVQLPLEGIGYHWLMPFIHQMWLQNVSDTRGIYLWTMPKRFPVCQSALHCPNQKRMAIPATTAKSPRRHKTISSRIRAELVCKAWSIRNVSSFIFSLLESKHL